jgi:glycosyltransferase involved in cell wall biosynthesis
MSKEDLAIVMPSYNEGKVLQETLNDLRGFPLVVLIDDASSDNSSEIALKFPNVCVLRHSINRGQGASLETGFEYVRRLGHIRYVATFDADGQHSVDDLQAMYQMIKNYDLKVILGSRFIGKTTKKSSLKQKLLRLYAKVIRTTVGLQVTDAHNGLRLFHIDFIKNVHISIDGFGHADEILKEIKNGGYEYREYFTTVKYTSYSLSKGQPLINGVNILFDKLWSSK